MPCRRAKLTGLGLCPSALASPEAVPEGAAQAGIGTRPLFLKELFNILSLLNDSLSKIVVPIGATPSVRSTGANYHFLYL